MIANNFPTKEQYRTVAKALGWRITDQYERLLRMGYPQDQIASFIAYHLQRIDGATDLSDTEKADSKLELHRFAKERLPNAPADWATVPVADFSDEDIKQIEQSKAIQAYLGYMSGQSAKNTELCRKEDVDQQELDHEKMLEEGWIEIVDTDEDIELNEELNLLSWLKRHVKPHSVQQSPPKVPNLAPAATHVAKLASKVVRSATKTHVYFHPHLKLFAGTIAGRPFRTTTEHGLFRHLTNNLKFHPHHATRVIETIKGGNPEGIGPNQVYPSSRTRSTLRGIGEDGARCDEPQEQGRASRVSQSPRRQGTRVGASRDEA